MQKLITCEICKSEIQEVSICPVCGAGQDMDIQEFSNWVTVFVTDNLVDATNYKGLLEGADIPVEILSQIDSTRMFTFGNLSVVKIMVPQQYEFESLEFFKSLKSSKNKYE